MTPSDVSHIEVEILKSDPSILHTVCAGLEQVTIYVANVVVPTANHQRKKIVKAGSWTRLADSDSLVKAKDFWTQHLQGLRIEKPLEGPIALSIEIVWPWRKSETKKAKQNGTLHHTTKPDLTNMAKTIEDRLREEGFIVDDAQVSILSVRKAWGNIGSFTIEIRELKSITRRG